MQLPARVATERERPLCRSPCRALLLTLCALPLAARSSSAFWFNLPSAPHPHRHAILVVGGGVHSRLAYNSGSGGDHGLARPFGLPESSVGRKRWSRLGRRLSLATAAAPGESGSSAQTEKVYRADDVLVRESDIAACKPYDECDTSPEALGTAFGGKEASTDGGGKGQGG
ncbi:unnamed protein product, partial [Ascophyllum nodosum]